MGGGGIHYDVIWCDNWGRVVLLLKMGEKQFLFRLQETAYPLSFVHCCQMVSKFGNHFGVCPNEKKRTIYCRLQPQNSHLLTSDNPACRASFQVCCTCDSLLPLVGTGKGHRRDSLRASTSQWLLRSSGPWWTPCIRGTPGTRDSHWGPRQQFHWGKRQRQKGHLYLKPDCTTCKL